MYVCVCVWFMHGRQKCVCVCVCVCVRLCNSSVELVVVGFLNGGAVDKCEFQRLRNA